MIHKLNHHLINKKKEEEKEEEWKSRIDEMNWYENRYKKRSSHTSRHETYKPWEDIKRYEKGKERPVWEQSVVQ